ncbi:MAG: hypothetical protein J5759_04015 [Bacteroidales bacterium]|nr:hypothetical protein [Bacteroidales bacterium]
MTFISHTIYRVVASTIALMLAASCAKVQTLTQKEPLVVSFQVGNSQQQTKTISGGSLLDEGCDNFYCNAWYYPAAGPAQSFMTDDEIRPDQIPNPTYWAPVRDHFWPKSGTVNFFSYASALPLGNHLSVSNEGRSFTITDYTVTGYDNIMIADAVYNATYANAGRSNEVLEVGNPNTPLTGVPTIFRHLLAQVEMDLTLYTASANVTTNTIYEVEVTDITLQNLRDEGSLTLTNTYSGGTAYGTQPWAPASNGTVIGWVPTGSARNVNLTPDSGNTIILSAGSSRGDRVIFLGGGSVMPQTLESSLAISITITIRTKHGDTTYNVDEGVVLHSGFYKSEIPSWAMNQRIIYHIDIDPVTRTLSFDPAIADWGSPIDGGSWQL